MAHRRDERPAEIDAHLPEHSLRTTWSNLAGKRAVSGRGLFGGPTKVVQLAGLLPHAGQGVHPLGEVVARTTIRRRSLTIV